MVTRNRQTLLETLRLVGSAGLIVVGLVALFVPSLHAGLWLWVAAVVVGILNVLVVLRNRSKRN